MTVVFKVCKLALQPFLLTVAARLTFANVGCNSKKKTKNLAIKHIDRVKVVLDMCLQSFVGEQMSHAVI